MGRKYEFTGETKKYIEKTLHRIRAVRSFGDVQSGDIGGWIEKENNLSHKNNAYVYGNAWVGGDAHVYDNACVYDNAHVYDNAYVYGDARVYDNAYVYGEAWVYGNARVGGNAYVYDNAEVSNRHDILHIVNIGSRNDDITFVRSRDSNILVRVGCFRGTIDEFEAAVTKTHGDNEYAQAYKLAVQLAKLRIKKTDV